MSTTKLAALRELEASLRQIKADYDLATDGDGDQQDHLPPATLSLLAVVEFVKQMPGWRGLDFGLNMLLDVLWEAHEGKTPKWLTNSRVGRREVPLKRTVPRAYCAGVMEFLMQNGRSREQAARFVPTQSCC